MLRTLRRICDEIDVDRSGSLDINEFVEAYQALNPSRTREVLVDFLNEIDDDSSGSIDFDEFVCVVAIPKFEVSFDDLEIAASINCQIGRASCRERV